MATISKYFFTFPKKTSKTRKTIIENVFVPLAAIFIDWMIIYEKKYCKEKKNIATETGRYWPEHK